MAKKSSSNPIKAVKSKPSTTSKRKDTSKSNTQKLWAWVGLIVIILFLLFALPFSRNAAFNFADRCFVWVGLGDEFQINSAEIKIPRSYGVHGIDVSHHNGKINWNNVETNVLRQDEPLSFVYIKATEGQDHLDTQFLYNWRTVKNTMLLRGAYHYYHPTIDPLKQAKWFIKNVELEEGDLPPVIDVEVRGKGSLNDFRANVLLMSKTLESNYGVKPILYTSHDYYTNYFNTKAFKDFKFWIARYDFHNKVEHEKSWLFWQHSEKGRVKGIKGMVDYNVFKGTINQLNRLCIN